MTQEIRTAFTSDAREWYYREGSGVICEHGSTPTKIIARYVDVKEAAEIICNHALTPKLVNALREVEAMLNTELARDYESQPWARQVRAVLMAYDTALAPALKEGDR